MIRSVCIAVLTLWVSITTVRGAEEKPVFIALDAEFGLANSTSAQSIKLGIDTAIREINAAGGVLNGRPLRLIIKDNRSIPARGMHNLKQLARVKDLVAVFSGKFSPVVLEELNILSANKIISLAPWASADGITENGMHPNYVFRLSLKDRYGMPAMLKFAANKGAAKVGLLLSNTSWGRSNLNAAERYFANTANPKSVGTSWYNWRDKSLLKEYRILRTAGAQAIILIANDDEGASLVSDVATLPKNQRLPIISHWGVTGGNFMGQMRHKHALGHIDFSVVQTVSMFTANKKKVAVVMKTVRQISGISEIADIEAPVRFGRAYDLTHILAKAMDLAGTTNRPKVRDALERVTDDNGLVRYFKHPFSPDNHDALKREDAFMVHYHADGTIRPIKP